MISIWSAFERFQEIHAPVTHIWITFSSISLGRCSVKLTEAPGHAIGVQSLVCDSIAYSISSGCAVSARSSRSVEYHTAGMGISSPGLGKRVQDAR
jgi:hypothetical protein